jgi:hypothetical protein
MAASNGATSRRAKPTLAKVSKEDRAAYEKATGKLTFTKDFFDHQQAVIADTRNTMGERFMACVIWRAWGQNCLFCVTDDGRDAWQPDFADWLLVDKRRISDLYAHYTERGNTERGYLRLERKRLYPVLNPTLSPGGKSPGPTGLFEDSDFAKWWKVQAPADFSAYMVHRDGGRKVPKSPAGRARQVQEVSD